MILRPEVLRAAAAAALLLSAPLGSDAFTSESFLGATRRRARSASLPPRRMSSQPPGAQHMGSTPRQPQQQPPQQYFDANGNPVAMPMVYDADGNLVPFNPTPNPPPAAQQQQQQQMPPQIVTGPTVVERPLPPKTKGTDSPRPVGFNPDAYAMSNTADVYFAQLKQDSKLRKIARMKGDLETANRVFEDDSVREIGESWNENPYTKEKNRAEARAEIEGTVRLQVQDYDDADFGTVATGMNYKQRLAEMQGKRSGGAGPAPKVEQSKAERPPPPKVEMPPPSVDAGRQQQHAGSVQSTPLAPVAETEAATSAPPADPVMPVSATQTTATQAAAAPTTAAPANPADPIADPVASVEAALERYKNAPPEEREGMVAQLREAMMAAASASVEAAVASPPPAEAAAAETSPPVAEAPPVQPQTQQQPPMMGFPTEYAVTQPDEEAAPAPPADDATPAGSYDDLALAATTMDASTVSALLASGLEMDEATTDAAFRAIVNAVDRAEALDQPLPGDVPVMLHHVFDADMKHLLTRDQERTNVTCMMPEQAGANRIGMNYIFDDSAHKDLPLEEGRRCEGGNCCDACSRNIFPTFASRAETSFETYPELTSLTFNDLADVSAATILQFTRLIERVRRTIAHEYGLPLKTILPLQAYSRKYVAGTTQKGGGGGEGDFVTLHTDEATHDGYHYSCVLYLSTQGEDFEGGSFVFNDPDPNYKSKKAAYVDNPDPAIEAKRAAQALLSGDVDDEDDEVEYATLADEIRKAGRVFAPYAPSRGAAVIFSSGWENMHEVEQITSGTRYCVPCFFTTCPVPDAAYDQMAVGKPKTNEDIADDWLHLLLAHQKEDAHVSLGRVKELLMKWHYICTPLSEH